MIDCHSFEALSLSFSIVDIYIDFNGVVAII